MSDGDNNFSILHHVFGVPESAEASSEQCPECEGGGWVQVYSNNPPAFQECPECCNPDDLPSP